MAEEASNINVTDRTGSNRTLRTCLIVGAGCVGVLVIGFCIMMALGMPIARALINNVDWVGGEALLDVIAGEFQSTLEASIGDELDEGFFLEFDETMEANFPDELEEVIPLDLPDVIFEGIQFSYPEGDDYQAIPEVMPAELEAEWFSQPERIIFSLNNYPLVDTFHEPRIIVMSTEALLAVNSGLEPSLDELEALLATQARTLERVPYIMPSFNAAQIITTQVDYLTFGNGKGVRFVTQYGQAAWPINNTDLFYAFQGLTDDGAYLLTAVLPVAHPSLPADGESHIGDDYEAFIEQYEAYLATTKQSVESQAPDSFNPGLGALDSMMATFQIEAP